MEHDTDLLACDCRILLKTDWILQIQRNLLAQLMNDAARYLNEKPQAAIEYDWIGGHQLAHTVKSGSTTQSLIASSSGEAEFYAVAKVGLSLSSICMNLRIQMKFEIQSDSSTANCSGGLVGSRTKNETHRHETFLSAGKSTRWRSQHPEGAPLDSGCDTNKSDELTDPSGDFRSTKGSTKLELEDHQQP